eukprot:s932_g6.t1
MVKRNQFESKAAYLVSIDNEDIQCDEHTVGLRPEIESDESASAICPAGVGEKVVERHRPENVKQKVVACFGQNGGLATSPVVVRCVPIGLKSRAASASTAVLRQRPKKSGATVGWAQWQWR